MLRIFKIISKSIYNLTIYIFTSKNILKVSRPRSFMYFSISTPHKNQYCYIWESQSALTSHKIELNLKNMFQLSVAAAHCFHIISVLVNFGPRETFPYFPYLHKHTTTPYIRFYLFVYIRIYSCKEATAGGPRRKKLSLAENKMLKQTGCVHNVYRKIKAQTQTLREYVATLLSSWNTGGCFVLLHSDFLTFYPEMEQPKHTYMWVFVFMCL